VTYAAAIEEKVQTNIAKTAFFIVAPSRREEIAAFDDAES
jgi:hypothetical protein